METLEERFGRLKPIIERTIISKYGFNPSQIDDLSQEALIRAWEMLNEGKQVNDTYIISGVIFRASHVFQKEVHKKDGKVIEHISAEDEESGIKDIPHQREFSRGDKLEIIHYYLEDRLGKGYLEKLTTYRNHRYKELVSNLGAFLVEHIFDLPLDRDLPSKITAETFERLNMGPLFHSVYEGSTEVFLRSSYPEMYSFAE